MSREICEPDWGCMNQSRNWTSGWRLTHKGMETARLLMKVCMTMYMMDRKMSLVTSVLTSVMTERGRGCRVMVEGFGEGNDIGMAIDFKWLNTNEWLYHSGPNC